MKLLITLSLMWFSIANLQAQSISHIETTKSWYYIYDQDGKKIKTLSTSQGELKGYSSSFYIIKQGSAFYITYDVNGKRLHTFGVALLVRYFLSAAIHSQVVTVPGFILGGKRVRR